MTREPRAVIDTNVLVSFLLRRRIDTLAWQNMLVDGLLCNVAQRWRSAPAARCWCGPIFLELAPGNADTPSASPGDLADAIVDCVDAGARILN